MKFLCNFVFLFWFIYLLSANCTSKHDQTTSAPPAPVYFSQNKKADIGFQNYLGSNIFQLRDKTLVALLQTNTGLLKSTSADYGSTWTPPEKIFKKNKKSEPIIPIISNGYFLGIISQQRVNNGGQLFFYPLNGETWQEPAPIRDTHWGNFGFNCFAADSSGNYYCQWQDWRNGNSDIYFSSSRDRGKTWSKNIRIDDDLSGQEQSHGKLLSISGGTLFVIWQDNRNLKTLYDIYFSCSEDGGNTWSKNIRINDDTTHSWQITPSVVLDQKDHIYVVWNDFREKEMSGDVISNVYFSRSTNCGKTWSPNILISRKNNYNIVYPRLILPPDHNLHCIWGTPSEGPMTEILHSYSINGGENWSEPALVNDDFSKSHHEVRMSGLFINDQEDQFIWWIDWRNQEPNIYYAKMMLQPDPLRPISNIKTDDLKQKSDIILSYQFGDRLFFDNFKNDISYKWKELAGVWVKNDNMYIGYDKAISLIDQVISLDFYYSGCFLLDLLNHRLANIYFQVKDDSDYLCYYRLSNIFRSGIRFEFYNGGSFESILEKPYRFQKNEWYNFEIVVKGNRMNYFINDSLLISTDNLKMQKGKLGIGTDAPPTYFKDIRVFEIY